MKNLFFLCFTIFFTQFSFSQYNEWAEAQVYFKDGNVLKGYVRLKVDGQDLLKSNGNEKLRFKSNLRERSKYFKAKEIEKFEVNARYFIKQKGKKIEKNRKALFIVINKNKKGTKKGFAELTISGKVSLVQRLAFPGNGAGVVKAYLEKLIVRDNEKAISLNPKLKSFKKWASEYFGDCPDLVKKIESKYYKSDDYIAVINYYNEKCFK